jgi:hypothetical protein
MNVGYMSRTKTVAGSGSEKSFLARLTNGDSVWDVDIGFPFRCDFIARLMFAMCNFLLDFFLAQAYSSFYEQA